jgi:hypothetical protein
MACDMMKNTIEIATTTIQIRKSVNELTEWMNAGTVVFRASIYSIFKYSYVGLYYPAASPRL